MYFPLGHDFPVKPFLPVEPNPPRRPLLRLYEEDPGSEYDGAYLFTPPLLEQVPLPELEE